jgi:hypothetical protein
MRSSPAPRPSCRWWRRTGSTRAAAVRGRPARPSAATTHSCRQLPLHVRPAAGRWPPTGASSAPAQCRGASLRCDLQQRPCSRLRTAGLALIRRRRHPATCHPRRRQQGSAVPQQHRHRPHRRPQAREAGRAGEAPGSAHPQLAHACARPGQLPGSCPAHAPGPSGRCAAAAGRRIAAWPCSCWPIGRAGAVGRGGWPGRLAGVRFGRRSVANYSASARLGHPGAMHSTGQQHGQHSAAGTPLQLEADLAWPGQARSRPDLLTRPELAWS